MVSLDMNSNRTGLPSTGMPSKSSFQIIVGNVLFTGSGIDW
jgi:hypothetical protein